MTLLEELKLKLRIDHEEHDPLLRRLIESAEEQVALDTNRSRENLMGFPGGYPAPVRTAVLMLAGHWYEENGVLIDGNRRESPLGYERIINKYRVFDEI